MVIKKQKCGTYYRRLIGEKKHFYDIKKSNFFIISPQKSEKFVNYANFRIRLMSLLHLLLLATKPLLDVERAEVGLDEVDGQVEVVV